MNGEYCAAMNDRNRLSEMPVLAPYCGGRKSLTMPCVIVDFVLTRCARCVCVSSMCCFALCAPQSHYSNVFCVAFAARTRSNCSWMCRGAQLKRAFSIPQISVLNKHYSLTRTYHKHCHRTEHSETHKFVCLLLPLFGLLKVCGHVITIASQAVCVNMTPPLQLGLASTQWSDKHKTPENPKTKSNPFCRVVYCCEAVKIATPIRMHSAHIRRARVMAM